jgi:YD repeat-containing protein
VQSPSGVVTAYKYGDSNFLLFPGEIGGQTLFPELDNDEAIFLLDERTTSVNGTVIERETRRYHNVWFFAGGVLPELARTDIQRDGRLYRTDYEYRSTNYGDFHRPYRIVETGELSRTTVRDFEYAFPYGFGNFATPPSGKKSIIGDVKKETVSVNGGPNLIREWTYDLDNGFLKIDNEYGISTTFSQINGNIATSKQNGVETAFGYSRGVVNSIQTPMYVVTRVINPEGTVASETRGGRTTSFRYDDAFRIVETTPPGSTYSVVTNYDNVGGTAVSVTRNGIGVVTYLDGFGRPVGTDQPGGVHTRTDYDVEGRKIYAGYPIYSGDRGDTITYDALNRLKKTTHPDGKEMLYTYGAGTVTIRDENLRDTVQTWSAFGNPDDRRLVTIKDAKLKTWTYEYTDLGRLHKVVAPDALERTWNYDTSNRLESETHPESGTTTYTYYPGTNLAFTKTDAIPLTTTFKYDDNGRVREVSGGGKTTTFTYQNGTDLKYTINAPGVETSFDLDAAGRIYRRRDSVNGDAFTQQFDYDRYDNLILITYADGRRVQYDYDGANRLKKVFDVDSGEVYARDFGYHASGALETFRAGNEIVHTTTYDTNRYWPRTMSAGDLQLTYDNYDGVGNVRSITDSRSGQSQTLAYDDLDRLTSASNSFYVATYDYDEHGNRKDAGGTAYSYQPGKLRLSSQSNLPGVTFGYDNNGNMTSGLGTFTYSPDNLVTSSTVQSVTANFLYDAEGWRVRKTVGSVNTSYLRGITGQLLTEWNHAAVPNGYAKDYIYIGSRLIASVKKTFTQ